MATTDGGTKCAPVAHTLAEKMDSPAGAPRSAALPPNTRAGLRPVLYRCEPWTPLYDNLAQRQMSRRTDCNHFEIGDRPEPEASLQRPSLFNQLLARCEPFAT